MSSSPAWTVRRVMNMITLPVFMPRTSTILANKFGSHCSTETRMHRTKRQAEEHTKAVQLSLQHKTHMHEITLQSEEPRKLPLPLRKTNRM